MLVVRLWGIPGGIPGSIVSGLDRESYSLVSGNLQDLGYLRRRSPGKSRAYDGMLYVMAVGRGVGPDTRYGARRLRREWLGTVGGARAVQTAREIVTQ